MNVLTSRVVRLLLVSGAILAGAAGVSYATAVATQSGAPAVIHGCYLNKIGTLRVIDPATQHCLAVETPIQWNETGPAGPPGESGAVASLDALNGVPCTIGGRSGQTMVTFNGPIIMMFTENIECVVADSSEPNDTRATEATFQGFGPEQSLYPAGDSDWFTVTGMFPGAQINSINVSQHMTGAPSVFNTPIHVELYQDGVLVASGDSGLQYSPTGSGHTFELHVSGPSAAAYSVTAM